MYTRRQMLTVAAPPAALAAAAATLRPRRAAAALHQLASAPGSPTELACEEELWAGVQRAFAVDRSLINLNNGGVSPSPVAVQEAMRRYLEFSNLAPVHTMWRVLEPQRETVRQELARTAGCQPEEVAITRNTSEGLEACQLGIPLRPGDEVLACDQEYPRMITTFRQRARREGIVLRQFPLPPPEAGPEAVVAAFAAQLGERTRAILVSHMVYLTGRVLPVREIAALGRRRGVWVLVDGAHAFAHLTFSLAELPCDAYAASLHKWLAAPHGTGLLYVRRERIGAIWPLLAAPEEMDENIRKFEEIGTHPAANALAIGEALAFHHGLGPERKLARLCHLRDRWAGRLTGHPRLRLHTPLGPGEAGAMATVEVIGVDPAALAEHLWARHRIIVAAITHPAVQGIRVAPSVYTTVGEIDRFAAALAEVAEKGLPA
ncbi:MAG: aminotransferase class V-fold PLP-dependent enzyme [Acidobacteriota bacterium]|jgi:selenocysteine lyase/cysteine desulfurase